MEQQPERKKRILSAIQPSGIPTLGNYLGALKNWVSMSEAYDCAYAVADLHAITVRQNPAELRRRTLELYALLLAIGLDPEKNLIFIQSQVSTHAQLAWVLNCYTQFGEMSRMTQFKDKSTQHADFVPVGADQKQHLEITRDIAGRFNGIYGNVFTIPEPYIGKEGARVMSLQEPEKKMSKSDPNVNGFISILDEPDVILRKFKRAITDSEARVAYEEGRSAINNLMGIYSCCTGKSMEQIEAEFEGRGYGDFKTAVAEAVIEELRPVQERFDSYMKNPDYLRDCAAKGAESAQRISQRTLDKVMKKVGFVLK